MLSKKIKSSLKWGAACSLTFIVIYNFCNWVTGLRTDVGTWYYVWELKIPFIPWMIVPYWSLDFFFVGGFFLCQSQTELTTLSKRLIAATVGAGACFLLLPLTTAFPRPEVHGFFGVWFQSLRAFDQTHNLFPSLHITYRTLLAALYVQHSRGGMKWLLHFWFSLIGFSTLFTYQHHVVDVLGGFLLALLCNYAFREEKTNAPRACNPAVGYRYGLLALLMVLVARLTWPWGGVALWPALSLFLTAGAYFGWGARVYRKEHGKLSWSAKLILAPVLMGHWLSFLHYRQQCEPWNEVAPGILLGRRLSKAEAKKAVEAGVRSVLDMTAESSENDGFLALSYLNLPTLDLTAPTLEQLEEGVAFIKKQVKEGNVYIHCKIGYSRSAALAAAYLLDAGLAATQEEAIAQLRKARPAIVIRPEIEAMLEAFQKALFNHKELVLP